MIDNRTQWQKNLDAMGYNKTRLKRISGCRYTPRQRRMFGRKMAIGRMFAKANAWQKAYE